MHKDACVCMWRGELRRTAAQQSAAPAAAKRGAETRCQKKEERRSLAQNPTIKGFNEQIYLCPRCSCGCAGKRAFRALRRSLGGTSLFQPRIPLMLRPTTFCKPQQPHAFGCYRRFNRNSCVLLTCLIRPFNHFKLPSASPILTASTMPSMRWNSARTTPQSQV